MIRNALFSFSNFFWGIQSNSHILENDKQKIYFANHTSHLDTITILTALPNNLKTVTRPVAAADYWGKTAINRYIAIKILNCVLIDRQKQKSTNPLDVVFEALEQGHSIIIFPEGTRGFDEIPTAFKPGIYHLQKKFPHAELIPVHLNNVNRSMPKGQLIPVPLICSITFGTPMEKFLEEDKESFLSRAREAVIALNPNKI